MSGDGSGVKGTFCDGFNTRVEVKGETKDDIWIADFGGQGAETSRRQPPTFGRHASGATTTSTVLLLLRTDRFLLTVGQRNWCVICLLLMYCHR